MRVLLVSTYELGHQPLHLASPAAALAGAGHQVRGLDLAVQSWETEAGPALAWAQVVAFSVPMHTAMRLALAAARSVRRDRPGLPIALYGLYAPVSAEVMVGAVADRCIAGEYEPALVTWIDDLARSAGDAPPPAGESGRPAPLAVQSGRPGPPAGPVSVELARSPFSVPARHLLPGLDRYAHLVSDDEDRVAGYVEASHGCAHRCRHCPVPVVYDGRTRAVDEDVVLADVAQLVTLGAEHITYGDPDFLNRPHHALRVARAVHAAFPDLTFDATVKVEHILRHRDVWAELADAGCLFVVSAFESVDDATLARLDKGHTVAESVAALGLLRAHGIEVRPSFLPFTPWTTLGHMVDLVDFVAAQDLVGSVDPVQYAIRLLVPQGSLLLGHPDLVAHLGAYDPEALSWSWYHPDPRVDGLQVQLSALAGGAAASAEPVTVTYARIRAAVLEATSGSPPAPLDPVPAGSARGRPRLTEPWFC